MAEQEQQLKIAGYFIKNAPAGQAPSVVADVATLLPTDCLTDDNVQAMLRVHNEECLVKCSDGDKAVLVSKYGAVDPGSNKYLDPSSGTVYKIDQRALTATATDEKSELKEEVEKFRAKIDEAVAVYVKEHYTENKAWSAVYGSDDGMVTIIVSGLNKKLAAYYSGGWRATYQLNVTDSGAQMKGACKVHVHYFEDGNVQLHAGKEKSIAVESGDPETLSKSIIKGMKKYESDWQSDIEDMYVQMHSTTFKAMRRILPITKQPMNWNPIAHAMQKDLIDK